MSSTLETVVSERFSARRLPVLLMTAFGALALLLASVGVYAMFASMAAAREREFGVRIALGASRRAIATLVLVQGGVWMLVGSAPSEVTNATRAASETATVVRVFWQVLFGPIALYMAVLGVALTLACAAAWAAFEVALGGASHR